MRTKIPELFYNVGVTEDELWRDIGRLLAEIRVRRGWKHPHDVHKAGKGSPNYATVAQHERGEFKTFTSLAEHARVLGVSVVDVFQSALDRSRQPLNPEAAMLLRRFEALSVENRHLVVVLAQQLFAGEAQVAERAPDPEPRKRAPRKK